MNETNDTTNGDKPQSPTAPHLSDANLRRFEELVSNVVYSRSQLWARSLMDPRRDLKDECGYPASPTIELYKELYEFEPYARRVVEIFPKECWSATPTVTESEDADDVTAFEQAWDELGKSLNNGSGASHYKDEEGSPVWGYLQRLDEQSRIGTCGILLIGIDDGLPTSMPVEGFPPDGPPVQQAKPSASNPTQLSPVGMGSRLPQYYQDYAVASRNPTSGPSMIPPSSSSGGSGGTKRKLLFLRVYDESLFQITQWESSPLSPRFSQPVMYQVTVNDPNKQTSGIGLPLNVIQVHWTRVVHVADNKTTNEVLGTPACQPVLHPLLDIRKVRGSSGEMFYKGALPGWQLSTHPQLGGDVAVDHTKLRDMMEDYQNGLQRWLALTGMSATSLAPQVSDPSAHIKVQVDAICVALPCPERIFMGSERGELASSQDSDEWDDRVQHRRVRHCTPNIIVPFVDRLIMMGVLPKPMDQGQKDQQTADTADSLFALPGSPPKGVPQPSANTARYRIILNAKPGDPPPPQPPSTPNTDSPTAVKTKTGYSVDWPTPDSLNAKDKAAVAAQKATALATYMTGGLQQLMTPLDFLTRILGMDEEEAASVIDAAQQEAEQAQMDQATNPFNLALGGMGGQFGQQGGEGQNGQGPPPVGDGPNDKPPFGKGGPLANYDPNQPRAADGTWASTVGSPDRFDSYEVPILKDLVELGHMTGSAAAAVVRALKKMLNKPIPTDNRFCATGEGGGIDPTCTVGDGVHESAHVASKDEQERSRKLALKKIKTASVPSEEEVAKAWAELRLAKEGKMRAGGQSQQNATTRKKQRRQLFAEFGGEEQGYVVCPWTGLKMHWSSDAEENPEGYPTFERGKIFVKCQGGGYQLPNLIPESFTANRSRNDARLRKQNSKGC